jgi:hypothetical protein
MNKSKIISTSACFFCFLCLWAKAQCMDDSDKSEQAKLTMSLGSLKSEILSEENPKLEVQMEPQDLGQLKIQVQLQIQVQAENPMKTVKLEPQTINLATTKGYQGIQQTQLTLAPQCLTLIMKQTQMQIEIQKEEIVNLDSQKFKIETSDLIKKWTPLKTRDLAFLWLKTRRFPGDFFVPERFLEVVKFQEQEGIGIPITQQKIKLPIRLSLDSPIDIELELEPQYLTALLRQPRPSCS